MTRLISFCINPKSPINKAVTAPITITKERAVSECSNNGDILATIKMPAVTIVAAWINAEIGVGPSIESGNQTCSGTCADLPIAPMNNKIQVTVITDHSVPENKLIDCLAIIGACENTSR